MTPEEIFNKNIEELDKLEQKKKEQIDIYIEFERIKNKVYNLIK